MAYQISKTNEGKIHQQKKTQNMLLKKEKEEEEKKRTREVIPTENLLHQDSRHYINQKPTKIIKHSLKIPRR